MAKEKDFDKEDTGGYKAPESRAQIIKSLADIPYQSSRHLCANTGASIDDVIEVIEGDDEITFQMVGAIAVYFLRTNEPTGKLYNTGNNSFAVKKPDEAPKVDKRKNLKASPELVEQCAFDGLSVKDAAVRLGFSHSTARVYLCSNHRPDLKEAWQRGKQRRKEMIVNLKPEPVEAEQIKHSSIPVTESEDEGFNEKFPPFPPGELAEILELGDEQFEQKMHALIPAGCGECGGTVSHFEFCSRFSEHFTTAKQDSEDLLEIPPQVETKQPSEHPLAPLTRYISENGYSPETLERVKAKLLETKPIPVSEVDTVQFTFTSEIVKRAHYRTVTLSNGKRIFMSEDINIFELKPREAELCARLVGLIDEFEQSEK
jgi:hypothetical protein